MDGNGDRYYMDENGVLQTGWFSIKGTNSKGEEYENRYYAQADGRVLKGGIHTVDNKQYYFDNGNLFLSSQDIKVILKNGSVIGNNGGVGSPTNGNQAIGFSYQWVVPINLDEVVAVRIGENDISIPN